MHPCRSTDGDEVWHGGGDGSPLLRAKFHPHRFNVSPLRGEKPQNRPLSKLNRPTGRLALRGLLPVITEISLCINKIYLKLLHKFTECFEYCNTNHWAHFIVLDSFLYCAVLFWKK